MDPSTPAAQDAQSQTSTAQQVSDVVNDQNIAQQASSDANGQVQTAASQSATVTQSQSAPQPPKKQQISISGGGIEEGASVMIAEDPDADDEEDEIQVAPQEKKNLGVMGQGNSEEEDDEQQIGGQQVVAAVQEAENVPELEPAVPEVVASSPEVEKLIEITSPEQPKINEELKNIGVTHSGPGVIDASQAHLPPPKIPVTYEQALNAEELIKNNRVHSSKFWLLEKIKYIWRKVNPNIALTVKPQTKKTMPVKKLPVKATTVPAKTTVTPVKPVQIAQTKTEVTIK